MGEHSPEFDNQPKAPNGRIDQHSSGNSVGGQQAAVGNDNFQFQDNSSNTYNYHFYSYTELQDEDLDPLSLPGKISNYLGVVISLLLALVFWLFFGLFVNFPFPYKQVIELLLSCFRGNVGCKVNRLQKRLQLDMVDLHSGSADNLSKPELVEKLNQLEFQTRIYLDVLRKLSFSNTGEHERIAKTFSALKQQRKWLQSTIKPLQGPEYRFVTKVHDFWDSLELSQIEKDLEQVESILGQITVAVKDSYPSRTILKDTTERLSREIQYKSQNINPYHLGILYSFERLLNEVSDKDISKLEESDLEKLNREVVNDLEKQKNVLFQNLTTALIEKESIQKELGKYSNEMLRLNNLSKKYETDLSQLQKINTQFQNINQAQKRDIYTLNNSLRESKNNLVTLQNQKKYLQNEINSLRNDFKQKKAEVEDLDNRLSQYSGMRGLKGEYIGNLSNKSSKYHYSRTCSDWKALVADYVLRIDLKRQIVSSSDPYYFIGKLGECATCAKRK